MTATEDKIIEAKAKLLEFFITSEDATFETIDFNAEGLTKYLDMVEGWLQ